MTSLHPPTADLRLDLEAGPRHAMQDATRTDDVRIGAVRPLITPALLQERVPVGGALLAQVEASRAAIADVLHGRDDRLIVVVGHARSTTTIRRSITRTC